MLFELRQIPLSLKANRERVQCFLADNGLRLDDVDYYVGLFPPGEDRLVGGGGLMNDIIKCVAVDDSLREEKASLTLISHLISKAYADGHPSVKVYTKPANRVIFESMGFHLLAQAPEAILMENSTQPIEAYKKYLSAAKNAVSAAGEQRSEALPTDSGGTSNFPERPIRRLEASAPNFPNLPNDQSTKRPSNFPKRLNDQSPKRPTGIIVMNANPFTLGHRYLAEQAARKVARLYIIVVREDRSLFSYGERLEMVRAGCSDLGNVIVLEGSDYQVSSATFPTYFLKRVTDAADTQMQLDLDLFCRHIAPTLGVDVRFVGSEPTDELTRKYNEWMHTLLPQHGIRVEEVERMAEDGTPVSASRVRERLLAHRLYDAFRLVPETTKPWLLAHIATQSLTRELLLTPKPGLVDGEDNGAHSDMTAALMRHSIAALHPFFVRWAANGWQEQPDTDLMQQLGHDAEAAMMQATGGINTHRGARFALGLTVSAAAHLLYIYARVREDDLHTTLIRLAKGIAPTADTHGTQVVQATQAQGALANAQAGYPLLFDEWLPFARQEVDLALTDDEPLLRLLMLIMSQLDDTNILYRRSEEAARQVKQQADDLFRHFNIDRLRDMNRRFIRENISPGGAADMLALTVFVQTVCG